MAYRSVAFIFVIASFLFYGSELTYFEPVTIVRPNKGPTKTPAKITFDKLQNVFRPQRSPSSISLNESPPNDRGFSDISLGIENRSAPEDEISRAPAAEKNQEPQGYFWELSPVISWKQLKSQDENQNITSKIRAISNTNLGLSCSYGMNLDDDFKLFTTLETEAVTFLNDSNSVELKNKKFLMNRVAVGAQVKSNWFFEVAMKDKLFLIAPTQTTIDIEKVTLPEIKTKYRANLYTLREASLSYAISGNLYLPSKGATINSQLGFGTGIILEARLRNKAFGIGYEKSYLKAIGNSTNMDNIFWRFTWEAF